MTRFINLCPHEVTIIDARGRRFDIISSGVGWVTLFEKPNGFIGDIPVLSYPVSGKLVGLPPPQEGLAYIVSHEVLTHPEVFGRSDVFAPGTRQRHNPYRDEQGRVVGVCVLLSAPAKEE